MTDPPGRPTPRDDQPGEAQPREQQPRDDQPRDDQPRHDQPRAAQPRDDMGSTAGPPPDWFDDAAVDAAIAARRRGRHLQERAQATATWSGTLTDLAERRAAVAVRTAAGTSHAGELVAVANDHLLLRRGGAVTLVARAGIVTVRLDDPAAPALPASGDRAAPQDRTLDEVLLAWAEDRSPCHLVLQGGETVAGVLATVGVDVVSVHETGRVVHVPLEAVVAVTVR